MRIRQTDSRIWMVDMAMVLTRNRFSVNMYLAGISKLRE